MQFAIGCAIWAYKGWVGELFPPGSRTSDFLSLYSQRFSAVEGNTTFYSIPDQATIARWVAQTPADFRFCLKLPRTLTHDGLLQPHLTATLNFLEKMQELGDRLGPCFAQLPPSYSPAHIEDLASFLEGLPHTAMDFALETRHPDWFQEPHRSRLTELLQSLAIARVLLDTRPIYDCPDNPQLHSERKKPRLPLQPIVTAPFSLIRYISHPTLVLNQTFFQAWVQQINTWLQQGTQVYFFVHCPLEERSPANARHFYQLLQQQNPTLPALPWDLVEPEPAQLRLFK
jgi:uncharacterized protein YecE (DUF72 family)